ncbi:hypothetical protein [Streptomyces sp. NPDC090026]|uniref:hypothetical protein n=1 Tax=Streptomyces sp. NPDC090026 TaxID=3365923 RepID=UPI00381547E4
MLADWYFCSALGLTTHQTKEYLDITQILCSPRSGSSELHVALERLAQQEEAVRLHALRSVLECAPAVRDDPSLADAAAAVWAGLLAGDDDGGEHTATERGLQEAALWHTLGDLLGEAFFPLPPDFAERVCAALEKAPAPKDITDRSRHIAPPPYHDLHEHPLESVALVLLDRAAEQRPDVVAAAWRSTRRLSLARTALRGESGRWPLLLAASALTRLKDTETSSEVRAALAASGQGAGYLEPDILAALASSWFGHAGEQEGPDLELLEAEIARGGLYLGWSGWEKGAVDVQSAVPDRLGVVGRGPNMSLGIALWQLTLWDLAAAHAPLETARRTGRWWAPPAGGRFPESGTAGLSVPWARLSEQDDQRAAWWLTRAAALHWTPASPQQLAPEQRVAAPGEPGRDPFAACSPWIERKNDFFRPDVNLSPMEAAEKSRFDTADRPVLLLQLAAVSVVSVHLLRITGALGGPEAQHAHDHLVGILFHAADVFCDPRFLTFLGELNRGAAEPTALPAYVTPSLAALIWHARTTVDSAGRGSFPEIRPRMLADFLINGPGTVRSTDATCTRGLEWRRLFIRPAWNIARLWINEASSGARRSSVTDSAPDGWYDGENPCARQVLAIGAQRMTELDLHRKPDSDPTSQSPFNSTLLRDFEGADAPRPDWMSQLDTPLPNGRPRTYIGYEQLLSAARYPLAEWALHRTRIEKLTSKGPALLAMRTVRLASLLDQSGPGAAHDEPAWVQEWHYAMVAINAPDQWARSIRAAAVGLFGPPDATYDPSTAAQDRLHDVLEVVVDCIVEFSPYAPRYYQLLLDRVARAGGRLSPETMNRLRARTVDAVRRRHDPDRLLPVRGGPQAELGARKARQDIEAELRLLVQALAETPLAWDSRRNLGMIVADGWRDTVLTPSTSLVTRPSAAFTTRTEQPAPDARLVVARVLDHFRGQDQFLVLPHRLGGERGREAVDLVAMSAAERARLLQRWRQRAQSHWAVGVVCSNSAGGSAEQNAEADYADDLVLVNWGGPEPLSAHSGGTRWWRTGDLCRVEVRWNGDTRRWEQAAPLLDTLPRRAPLPGETRSARLSPAGERDRVPVVLSVEGEVRPPFAAAAESLHTAWLRWQPDLSRRWSGQDGTTETMARWDDALNCWLPADRTLTELIADDLPYRGDDGRRATVLVYTGSVLPPAAGLPGGRYYVTAAGRTYLLRAQDWATPPEVLGRVLRHGPGTLVYAGLSPGARLELLNDPPEGAETRWPSLARGGGCDLRNTAWLKLFSDAEGEQWEAELVDGQWTVDVSRARNFPQGAGFPPRIAVRGLDGAPGTRWAFHPEPWENTVEDAAVAVVSGEPLSGDPLSDHDTPSRGRFESFWNVAERTVLPVERFFGGRQVKWGTVEALIPDGMTVQVDRSSLPFGRVPTPHRGMPLVEITRVRARNGEPARPAAPLSDADFLACLPKDAPPHPGSSAPPGLLPADRTVRGVVTGVLRREDGTSHGYQVWLDLDGRFVPATLPAASFTRHHRRNGETFTAVRSATPAGAWAFVPRLHKVFGQALHRCEDAERPPGGSLRFLGRAGTRAYYAHPEGGPLVSVPAVDVPAAPVGHGGTVVADLGTGQPLDNVPRRRLLVRAGGLEVVGDAPEHGGADGRVTDVTLRAWRREGGLVALHRGLTVRTRATASADVRTGQPTRTREEEWREQLDNGETVTLRGRLLGNGTLLASGVTVPLVPGDAPHVVGSSYGDDAEALLVLSGSMLLASTRDAPPRDPARFAAAVTGAPEGMPVPRRNLVRDVYYVGAEQRDGVLVRRFEWGNGLTAEMGPDRLTVNGRRCGNEQAFPLHHGDRLTALRVAMKADGTVVVDIRPEDVEIQVGRQAYVEATHGVVHQLELAVDPRTRSVVVRKVRLRGTTVSGEASDYSRAYPIAAELDTVSRDEVLAAVQATPRTAEDLAHLQILARLDQDAYKEDQKRRRFTYVQARLSAVRAGGVVDGEHVFMVAGAVQSTGNDAFIEFRLPGKPLVPPGQKRPLTVRVRRRQFSAREYLLPQLVAEKRTGYYQDTAVMLVSLQQDERTKRWFGDLMSPPARDAAALTGAVRQAGGRLLAVLTSDWDKVEVRPGVVYDLPEKTQGPPAARKAGRGALVVVSEVSGGLRLDLAQDADRSFVPEDTARPAVALPKDTLLGTSGKWHPDDGGQFTAAGLRGMSVTAEEGHGVPLLATPHPKLALLRRSGGRVALTRPVGEPVRAARVRTDGDRPQAEVVVHEGSPKRPDGQPVLPSFMLPWALLSFRDAAPEALRHTCRTTTWSYHDTTTSHTLKDGTLKTPPDDISERSLAVEAVLFDEEAGAWTLRYHPERIRWYGMPATVLTEQPRDPEQLYYPSVHTVACPSVPAQGGEARGLWLELSPGRVVEVGGRLLMGPGRQGLERLDWSLFGPGDQVHLEIVRGELTAPRRLRLVKWQPGPRSALLPPGAEDKGGSGRTLLPVDRVDARRGALRLGRGDYTLTYPAGPDAERYRSGQAVILHRSNHLTRYDTRKPPSAGDTALLGWSGGRLCVLGLHGTAVRPADRTDTFWPGAGWLYDALTGPELAEAVATLGGALPVTLEEPDEDGTLVVSRRLQPTSALSRNGLLRLEAVAALGSALVLRAGPALHLLAVSDVVRGVPDAHAAEVAGALAKARQLVWLRLTGTPGRPLKTEAHLAVPAPRPYGDEFAAVPFAAVGPDAAPVGVLVHTPHDQGYRWLPTELLSWAGALTAQEISAAFVAPGTPLHVREQHGGAVSAVGARRVWRARQDLALGSKLRVEPLPWPGAPADDSSPRPEGHLALAQPYGMLVRLVAPAKARSRGQALDTEVAALGQGGAFGVRVMPSSTRRVTLDLPRRVAAGNARDAAAERDDIAARHRQWLAEGWAASPVTGAAEPDANADAAVLRAWPCTVMESRLGQRDQAGREPRPADTRRSFAALRQWLDAHGADAFGLRQEEELELAPTLAACLLMAHAGAENPVLARGAVLFAHQTGLRAGRSLHVEPVVRTWASPATSHRRTTGATADTSGSPLDARLAALRLPGTVDRTGLESILRFGHGVLGRVDADTQAHRLDGTARAVLASVGQLSANMNLRADAATLALVADLGRALHPPHEEAVAQSALLPPQTDLLGGVLTRVVSEGPLSLLPVPARLPHPAERLAREVLRQASAQP